MKLLLGVTDIPYSQAPGKKQRKATPSTVTTGDVAEILEAKYNVMETFFKVHEKDIAADLENSLAGALESMLMNAPVDLNAFGAATTEIEQRFNNFIVHKEMDALGIPGVPTKAAIEGASSRKKGRKGKPDRPSFYDTGLYVNSFKAEVE